MAPAAVVTGTPTGNGGSTAGTACEHRRVHEVRRSDDNELCGHVHLTDGGWSALTVFGGVLGTFPERESASLLVLAEGLSSLTERWWYRGSPSEEWQVVCIQEASPAEVRIALGYYSMPGVPTLVVSRAELDGPASLVREPS